MRSLLPTRVVPPIAAALARLLLLAAALLAAVVLSAVYGLGGCSSSDSYRREGEVCVYMRQTAGLSSSWLCLFLNTQNTPSNLTNSGACLTSIPWASSKETTAADGLGWSQSPPSCGPSVLQYNIPGGGGGQYGSGHVLRDEPRRDMPRAATDQPFIRQLAQGPVPVLAFVRKLVKEST